MRIIIRFLLFVVLLSLCTSCAVIDKMDFPDDVHYNIEHQPQGMMSKDTNFGK